MLTTQSSPAELRSGDMNSISSLLSTHSSASDVNSTHDVESTSPTALSVDPTSETAITRHEHFFLQDEHIHIQAGNIMFRVHSYLFARESEKAREVVARAIGDGVVVLQDVDAVDLERFFEVLYCRFVQYRFFLV
jgi:hypothetical protein